jgi:hypothetical protein
MLKVFVHHVLQNVIPRNIQFMKMKGNISEDADPETGNFETVSSHLFKDLKKHRTME